MWRLYRADPEVRPTGSLNQLWDTEILDHIDKDMEPARRKIRSKSNCKTTMDTMFTSDLLMTGTAQIGAKQVLLTPCIWFFCGSRWCRRIVKEVAKDMDWPKLYGIQQDCKYEVGGPVLAAHEDGPTSHEEGGLQLDLEHGIHLSDHFRAYLHVQDPDSLRERTAVGLACCATITQDHTIISQKLARVAGIVEMENIDGSEKTCFGLTTCHHLVNANIEPSHEEFQINSQESSCDTVPSQENHETTYAESDVDSDVDSDDYSDEASFTVGFEPHSSPSIRKTNPLSDVRWINVSQCVGGDFAGLNVGCSTSKRPGLPVADLAVFKLPLLQHDFDYNTYRNPSGNPIRLDFCLSDTLGSDEVYIINDTAAACLAYPLSGPMHFCIRGEILETVRVKCAKPLGMWFCPMYTSQFTYILRHWLVWIVRCER